MKVGTRLWTTLAAAGLMALPLSTAAQSTSSTQSGQSSTPTPQSGQEKYLPYATISPPLPPALLLAISIGRTVYEVDARAAF